MRAPGLRTQLRFRLAWLGRRLDYLGVCALLVFTEIYLLVRVRPRTTLPPRHGLFVPGKSPRQAARRLVNDPRFMPSMGKR